MLYFLNFKDTVCSVVFCIHFCMKTRDTIANISFTKIIKLFFFPGRCHCRKNRETGQRFCRIEMSSKVLDDSERLRDTLIHEICHAAVWIISEENDVIIWNSCSRNFNCTKSSNADEPKCFECVNFWVKLNWSHRNKPNFDFFALLKCQLWSAGFF